MSAANNKIDERVVPYVRLRKEREARRRKKVRGALALFFVCNLVAAVLIYGASLPVDGAPVSYVASDSDSWQLVLVNDEHPIAPCQPELTQLRDGQAVDSRCYPDLQRMFDDARAAGLLPAINSSWRSREEQQQILDATAASYREQGFSADEARRQALRTVAEPGCSEHETGLAIDVTSDLHTSEGDTAVHQWMAEHGWEYGWVLRYPAGKEGLTGIDYEPWHFRYVGVDAAREMHEQDLCLEEYIAARD